MKEQEETNLNTDAKGVRPKRNAPAVADPRNRDINAIDDDESNI